MKNGNFLLGIATISLRIHGNRSLKGKRSVLNRIKSRLKNSYNISVAEVGDQDNHQSALLAVTAVSGDRGYLEGQLTSLAGFIEGITDAEIIDFQTHIEVKGRDDGIFL